MSWTLPRLGEVRLFFWADGLWSVVGEAKSGQKIFTVYYFLDTKILRKLVNGQTDLLILIDLCGPFIHTNIQHTKSFLYKVISKHFFLSKVLDYIQRN
jgi:hypothetical protein